MAAGEREALASWLAGHPAHRQALDEAERAWERIGRAAHRLGPPLGSGERPTRRWLLLSLGGAAAAAALGVALWPRPEPRSPERTFATAVGERKRVLLPDGTAVDLNTDTAVRIRFDRSRREVALDRGEALFTVPHGDPRPFEVLAAGGRILDLGTSFGVLLDGARAAVTVAEGRVRVAGPEGNALDLGAGERAAYGARGPVGPAERVDARALHAWREGRLVVRDRPLDEVVRQLARHHPVIPAVAPAVGVLRVSGSFDLADLPGALAALEAALPVRARVRGGAVVVEPRPARR
jgi:transmembrane sensor